MVFTAYLPCGLLLYLSPLLQFYFCLGTIQVVKFPNLFIFSLMVVAAAAAAKSLQSCPTLCDPIDSSPPGSPVPGILQARILEWGAISFSNAWKWKVKVKLLSHVQFPVTPWTAPYQAPLSMRFSRQNYRSGVPLTSPLMVANKLINDFHSSRF